MSTTKTSRLGQIVSDISRVWEEMDYAQRRLLEIRTGVELTRREPAPINIDELERLYAYQPPDCSSEGRVAA